MCINVFIMSVLNLSNQDSTMEQSNDTFFNESILLLNLSMIIKNPAFSEEKEMRIVLIPLEHCGKEFQIPELGLGIEQIRLLGDRVSTYFPLRFDGAGLQLTKIVLGPKNNSHERDIKLLLERHGFNSVCISDISRSAATYR